MINYADTLSSWDNYLDRDGDILLYGCNVGAGIAGAEFVNDFSKHTKADVAASIDLTGSNSLNGNWDLEYSVGDIEATTIKERIESDFDGVLVGSGFTSGSYLDDYLDLNFPEFNDRLFFDFPIDNQITISDDTRIFYDNNGNALISDVGKVYVYDKGNDDDFDLDPYDFRNPEINTTIFSFTPTQIDFSPTSFDFVSLSIDSNSISFKFDPSDFQQFSAKFDFLSEIDSTDIKLAFENYNFNFGSNFFFNADAVTIGTTGNNTITFDYDPNSFNFEAANLFKTNANLFDYKFLDSDISLINDEIPFAEYNASDYRALEYAFVGDELFDPEYYLANNVIPEGQNPFTDYIENGYRAGKDPHALFDVDYYLFANTDVRITETEPFSHYVTDGFKQLRNPHPLFNTAYYNEQNTDV